jgi:hypothetical protein
MASNRGVEATVRTMVLCMTVLVAACATKYDPEHDGGFHERQLAADPPVFEVYVRGNRYTSQRMTREYATLRAAEIALEKGYPYFLIADSRSWEKVYESVLPGVAAGSATASMNRIDAAGVYAPPSTVKHGTPRYRMTAILLRGDQVSDDTFPAPLDAAQTFRELVDKYNLDRPMPRPVD